MGKYDWNSLNHLQVGRFGESFVKLELTRLGCDVYTSDVDDRGIDFIVRLDSSHYLDIQVKTVRGYSYVYAREASFPDAENLYLALVILQNDAQPQMFCIPRTRWRSPDQVFVYRAYTDAKSPPEYGINLSAKNFRSLSEFSIDRVAAEWARTIPKP